MIRSGWRRPRASSWGRGAPTSAMSSPLYAVVRGDQLGAATRRRSTARGPRGAVVESAAQVAGSGVVPSFASIDTDEAWVASDEGMW